MNYLYNGVELPALPEYDATRYRYSFIYLRNNGVYHFFALTSNIEYSPDGTDGNDIVTVDAGTWVQYRLYDLSGEWTFFSENNQYATLTTCDIEAGDKLIWSSHDIIDTTDNSLYLAASDPIPVGGEPENPTTFTPDPISMTLGWLVGRRIAGQRK